MKKEIHFVVDDEGNRQKGPFGNRRKAADKAKLLRERNRNYPVDFWVETVQNDKADSGSSQDTMYALKDDGTVVEIFEDKNKAVAYRSQMNDQARWDGRSPDYTVEEIENSETTDADDTNETMSYNTLVSDSEAQTEDNTSDHNQMTFGETYDWGYGNHRSASEATLSGIDTAIDSMKADLDNEVDDDMLAVLEDASDLVNDIDVNDFECSHPDCGLSHGHGERKHDIRNDVNCGGVEGFNITDEFAEEMEFVPNCHCGANEAAMLMPFLHYFNIPMFSDQYQFESVLEMEADVVNEIYRQYQDSEHSLDMVVGQVAANRGVAESEMAPLGIRPELKIYIERREHVESGANAAPIGQHTRTVINNLRDELEVATQE